MSSGGHFYVSPDTRKETDSLFHWLSNFKKGETTLTNTALAEELLIHSHQPVYNIRNKQTINEERIMNVHVFNWGASKKLFPEVSGRRFTSRFDHIGEEHIYRCEDNE